MNQSRKQVSNWLLVLGVVALVVAPLIIVRGSEFAGADGQAEEIIKQVKPDYEPWFNPILAPPGGETESLLFASQAGLGAGLIGYVIGFYRGRQRQ